MIEIVGMIFKTEKGGGGLIDILSFSAECMWQIFFHLCEKNFVVSSNNNR